MITITKDKIFSSDFSLKQTRPGSDTVEEIDVDKIVFSMGEGIELGEDVTFERLFDIIIFHKSFFNILFNAEMDGLEIDDFINDYEQEFDLVVPNQDYRLMISWDVVVYDIVGVIEIYDYPSFHAFGKLDTTISGENYPISLALSSLSEFRKKLIFIDNSFEIKDNNSIEAEVLFKANYRPLTLHQLFAAILHEISQYGSPEERAETRRNVEARSEEMENWVDDESVEDEYVPSVIDEINQIIDKEYDDTDNLTFWDTLYPSDKPTGKSSKEAVDEAMIIMSEKEDMPSLEELLADAEEVEDYEKAAKIKKLIDKRDEKKKK